MDLSKTFIENVIAIAYDAGALICALPQQRVDYKKDNSPVTNVDLASSVFICEKIAALTPNIPVISEECLPPHNLDVPAFWLIDPIDGTRSFMQGLHDFCVSIALIENGRPILGVLYGPMVQKLYVGSRDSGAFMRDLHGNQKPLKTRPYPKNGLSVLHSRSDDATAFLKGSHPKFIIHDDCGISSALKFGMIAEGLADFYPRFGPTGEWDIAAGQIILEAAGGCVITPDGKPLAYNKKDYMNGGFFAWGNGPL